MNASRARLIVVGILALLAGCATTDNEISQKDREKMAREAERANRKEAQQQSKMLRESGQGRRTR